MHCASLFCDDQVGLNFCIYENAVIGVCYNLRITEVECLFSIKN